MKSAFTLGSTAVISVDRGSKTLEPLYLMVNRVPVGDRVVFFPQQRQQMEAMCLGATLQCMIFWENEPLTSCTEHLQSVEPEWSPTSSANQAFDP